MSTKIEDGFHNIFFSDDKIINNCVNFHQFAKIYILIWPKLLVVFNLPVNKKNYSYHKIIIQDFINHKHFANKNTIRI